MNNHADKLNKLRKIFVSKKIDGFLIPRADAHQGEEVIARDERLSWLTGFTGSAGVAIVLKDKAVVLTDGRYTIQVKQQTDSNLFETEDSVKYSTGRWINENAQKGDIIGYDPWLHTPAQIKNIKEELELAGISLKTLSCNLIDKIWESRPETPKTEIKIFPEKYAGLSSTQKLEKVSASIIGKRATHAVITLPDSIAWLLNIRGNDLTHTPVALSFAFINAEDKTIDWFIEEQKISKEIKDHLGENVRILSPSTMEEEISALSGEPVLFDKLRSCMWLHEKLKTSGAKIVKSKDPCIPLKAIKTLQEQDAMIEAHRRDGIALVRFLSWMDKQDFSANSFLETDISDRLEHYRSECPEHMGQSFDTISGFGSNGAIVHYRANPETAAILRPDNLLLLDSGGQYKYGTTDVTRTIATGVPSQAMKKHFTLVLKGHISISSATFPEGTTGAQIDTLARKPLWNENLDYAHGTGHGVGCFLGVHEEAASFSPRTPEKLASGMIISNEPGFYLEGEYGIRIENLVLVEKTGKVNHTGADMLAVKTLTLAPYDRKLIIPEMLDKKELDWLNNYHQRVREELDPLLENDEDKKWLKKATSTITP